MNLRFGILKSDNNRAGSIAVQPQKAGQQHKLANYMNDYNNNYNRYCNSFRV